VDHEDTADGWDQRYGSSQRWWSGHVNAALAAEVGHLPPATALDVGCGEGADAIWLAERGWRVTAVDISEVALDRASRAASEAGVDVEWLRADVTAGDAEIGTYDLVSVQYPALPRTPDGSIIRAITAAVAPGGTLLVVGHDFDADHHPEHGFDPAERMQPADLREALDSEWTLEVDETRPRVNPPGHRGPDVPDVVLRARRR
jgi:SAM-dependent methyltransferase